MSQILSPEPATDGRDTTGRFAKGNHLGTGNPFARQTAALRAALVDSVTEQDIKEIAYILLLNAKAGDLASIKLLFLYVIGKPQPAVDPDTLDAQEMKAFQQQSLHTEEMEALRTGVPSSAILPYQRLFVEAHEKQLGEMCLEQLRQWEQEHADEEQPVAQTEKEVVTPCGKSSHQSKPPSTNGSDGEETEPAPSTNGRHRTATEVLFSWLRGQPTAPRRDAGP